LNTDVQGCPSILANMVNIKKNRMMKIARQLRPITEITKLKIRTD